MIFIPVAAVVVSAWMIVYAVRGTRKVNIDSEIQRNLQKMEKLNSSVIDEEFAAEAERRIRTGGNMYTHIQKYMEGGPEWEEFARNTGKDTLAALNLAAVMMRKGKLPGSIVNSHHVYSSRKTMTPKQWAGMHETFLLHIEDDLNARGIPAAAMCRDGFPNRGEDISVRKRVSLEGPGCTYGNKEHWFALK